MINKVSERDQSKKIHDVSSSVKRILFVKRNFYNLCLRSFWEIKSRKREDQIFPNFNSINVPSISEANMIRSKLKSTKATVFEASHTRFCDIIFRFILYWKFKFCRKDGWIKRVKDHQALAKLEKKIGQMKIYLLHRGIIFYRRKKIWLRKHRNW